MKKSPNTITADECLREIASIFAHGIVRMEEANILLSAPSKPAEPSLSKFPTTAVSRK